MAELKSFSDFKKSFYGRVKDFSLFDVADYNLIKVVLDGLKVDYLSRGKIRVFVFWSPIRIGIYFFLIRLRKLFSGSKDFDFKKQVDKISKMGKRKFGTIDPGGRSIQANGKVESFYFKNVHEALGREQVIAFAEGMKGQIAENDFHIRGYDAGSLAQSGGISREDKKVLKDLLHVFRKIKNSKLFAPDELSNIKIAFQQFFIEYKIWKSILAVVEIEKIFLWPHYHREGCIYAFRKKNISVIELQHGLIAAEDIFYILPESTRSIEKRALFADEIWVYGQFWKEQLLKGAGYSESQIKICGYYPFVTIPSRELVSKYSELFPLTKKILVTTQTFMHEFFVHYIQFLSDDIAKRNLPWSILVKLHPAESSEKYNALLKLENVKIVNENLDVLFPAVHLHVSCFSTTLFDAIRFGIPNFSIDNKMFRDYISFFEKEKISKVINEDQNPIDFPIDSTQTIKKEYYFEEFNRNLFSVKNIE